MIESKKSIALWAVSVAAALLLFFVTSQEITFGRGGGGGFHGGGSGFRGDAGGESGSRSFGNREFGNDSFDDRGFDDRDFADRDFGRDGLDSDRPTAFSRPYGGELGDRRDADGADRPSEADLRAGADKAWGRSMERSLATDGGFGRMLSRSDMRGLVHPGRSTSPISSQALASRGNAVRNAFRRNDLFNQSWWANHPGAWYNTAWGSAWAWGATGWPALAGFWGLPAVDLPIDYDYGSNITYENDTVYYGSQPVATADEYYTQAQSLAQSAPDASQETSQPQQASQVQDWKPLGVFSLTQGGQADSNVMFQLAVDKAGAICGNYYNVLTDEVKPVAGAVDKKRMRAAWTVGNNKDIVYETGMSNLLQPQSTALIHFGKDKTEQWTLVRLEQPKQGATL